MYILKRDFNNDLVSKKNEDLFSNIFIDSDLLLKHNNFYYIDNWNSSNIKKLISFLKKENNLEKKYFLHYKYWNNNLELIYKELNPIFEENNQKLDFNIIKALQTKDLGNLISLFSKLDNNQKVTLILKIINENNFTEFYKDLNNSINNKLISLNIVFNKVLFKLLLSH